MPFTSNSRTDLKDYYSVPSTTLPLLSFLSINKEAKRTPMALTSMTLHSHHDIQIHSYLLCVVSFRPELQQYYFRLCVWQYVQSLNRLGRRGGRVETGWGVGGMTDDSAEILFHSFQRRLLLAVFAWAGMSTLWCCPSSISSADHIVTHLSN